MKILVHVCCAPDAVYFLKRLRENFPNAELCAFFYDPNIHPYEEYRLRLLETERTCHHLNITLYEGEYDLESWMRAVKGLEEEPERGKRCEVCFDYRLERSARFAKEISATHFTTTLLMSPKKDIRTLSEVGRRLSETLGIEFLALDYRKGGGTQEMFKLSKELELYHQDYCGCIYGLFKQKKDKAMWDLISFGGRRPGSREEKLFIKEVRLFAERLGLSCKEWEFSFLNWRLLNSSLTVEGQAIAHYVVPFSRSVKGLLRSQIQEVVGDVIYYKKGVRVVLLERLQDLPLEEINPLSDPTLLVSKEHREILLKGPISLQLDAELSWDLSSVLLVGSQGAERFLSFPADTLQDQRGVSLKEICTFIQEREREIKEGTVAVALLGAESLGRCGSRFLEDRLGTKIGEDQWTLCCW